MMHHPQPQHPHSASTREYRYNYNPHSTETNPNSVSRSVTSNVRSPRTPTHNEDRYPADMMIETSQYAGNTYPPSYSGNYGPASTNYSPATYHEFQAPEQRYQSQPAPQSPTYALRPAQPHNVFSHIEHPAEPLENLSSDEEDDYGSQATTPHHSHQHMRTPSQSYYEAGAHTNTQQQSNRGMSQTDNSNPYALNRPPASVPTTQAGPMQPVMTYRPRGRNTSDSSIGSMVSNAAVFGDAIYRTDTLYDVVESRSTKQSASQFQLQSAPSTYPPELPDGRQDRTFRLYKPPSAASDVEPPYIHPPSPHPAGELELQDPDHPFVYKGADWDYPLRGLRAMTASTDVDAMSLDEHRTSSSGSSEASTAFNKGRGRKATQSVDSSARDASGDGKRKTSMACHFCRFRKLRCDGGTPCSHCVKRGKDCTYDATIRRRGPGRKNKSAQETARVQLAQRQREEASREMTKAQSAAQRRDNSMQTSPKKNEAMSQVEYYPGSSSSRYIDSTPNQQLAGSPSSQCMGSPSSQYTGSSTARNTLAFPSVEFQTQHRSQQHSPRRPNEYQAFEIPFQHEQVGVPEVFPASLAHQQQQGQSLSLQGYRSPDGQPPYGVQAPVSAGSFGYYDGSPDRHPASNQSQYATSSYSQGYSSNRHQGDAYTDTDSVYAYSEGANIVPSKYGGHLHVPPPPRSDAQMSYERDGGGVVYPEESASRTRIEIRGREWRGGQQ